MMGGPATGRMFGGLNNISGGLLKNLGGLGGNGGLGALGSLLSGGAGGLGGLGSLLGGNGGLGNLGNLAGMMGNMGGKKPHNGNNNNFDINSILGALGGNGGGNNGGLDLNSILSQLGNMQQQAANAAPPEPQREEEPIREARFKPTDEPNTGFAEERFQDPAKQQAKATGTNQNTAAGGMPNISPELLQMLNNFFGSQAKQANQGQQGQRPRHGKPGAGGQQNAYRQQSAGQQGGATEQPRATAAQDTAQAAQPRFCDICFDCPLNCPRAGLKLPAYAQVRQLAQGWQRY